jgi:hypothetical protein
MNLGDRTPSYIQEMPSKHRSNIYNDLIGP